MIWQSVVFNVVFFLCCYLFGKIIEKSKIEMHFSIVEGFVFLLGLHEILALPFVILHKPFKLYFVTVFLIISAIILWILWVNRFFLRKLERVDKSIILYARKRPNKLVFIIILIIAVQIFLSTVMVKYDFDDSFYLSLMQQNINDPSLYSYDPSTGNPSYSFTPQYSLESWELFVSFLSFLSGLSVPIVAHTLIPIVIIVISYISYAKLFGELVNKSYVPLMLIFLSVIFFMGGYAPYDQGNFLLSRSWQGKAVLVSVLLPNLLYHLLKYLNDLNKKRIIYISCINIAAFGLNPSAVYLCTITTFSFIVLGIFHSDNKLSILKGLVISLIPLGMLSSGLYVMIQRWQMNWRLTNTELFNFYRILKGIIGNGYYLPLYLISLPILYIITKDNAKKLLFWHTAILILTVINPITSVFVAKYFTAVSTYWRVFWLIPVGTAISYIGVKFVIFMSQKLKTIHPALKEPRNQFLAVIVYCIIIIASGSFVYGEKNGFVYMVNNYKIPQGVKSLGLYIASENQTKVKMAAPEEVAMYIRGVTSNVDLVFTKDTYMRNFLDPAKEEYKDKWQLNEILNGNLKDYSNIRNWLERYNIEYIVCEKDDKNLCNYLEKINLKREFETDNYLLFHVAPKFL